MINRSDADWFHVDIMDGMFVPNISFGFPIVNTVKKHAAKELDVHLMIVDPDRYLKSFSDAGASGMTVHYETTVITCTVRCNILKSWVAGHALRLIRIHLYLYWKILLADLDMVLIMSVNPGFGGQKFIEHTYKKLRDIKTLSSEYNPDLYIEVDGGVDAQNALQLIEAGANVLVAGNSVFSSPNPLAAIAGLKSAGAESRS